MRITPAIWKRKVALILVIGLSFQLVNGQLSQGGTPYSKKDSYLKSSVVVPVHISEELNIESLLERDREYPVPFRYSVFEDVNIDIKKAGNASFLPEEGGTMWRYSIESADAISIQLYFSMYNLPEGAKLFLYNEDYSSIYGAFTNINNHPDRSLMIADFAGSTVIVEYFEPVDAEFEGDVIIGAIGQGYREIEKITSSVDEDGYINVNCHEGVNWQNEKHSVCRFTFRIDGNGYQCSGALINNVKSDGTPYFLTAAHCLGTETAASTVVAYFNFEYIGCDGPLRSNNSTLSGASLLGTAAASDYTLLLFDNIPPASYQPYYAGWDASGDPGEYSTGIHHPQGYPKKISLDDSAAIDYGSTISWEGGLTTPANSHWMVVFDRGITNGGSSGSPLFNQNGHIIGQLHGGSDQTDYYGKLDYSWTTTSGTGKTLKSFLDPDNTGTLLHNGYYPLSNPPDPQFYPEFKNICESAAISLYGFSAFQPLSWEWSFVPDNITFLDGTNAQTKNPVIAFNAIGEYDVILKVTNEESSVERTFSESIVSGGLLSLDIEPVALKDNCLCNFDSLTVVAGGAKEFVWELQGDFADNFFIVNDTLNPAVIKSLVPPDTTTIISLLVNGSHGNCTAETTYDLTLVKQVNDMAEGAIRIFEGKNGPFSNECASVEDGEPVPPFDSCTGQLSWCDEYGTGEDIVENSVWFYFIPDSTAGYTLISSGMDNQTAVYEAESVNSILSGEYNLLGANDDYTSKNFNPIIKKLELTEGKQYWIQVDGSAGGETGEFTLEMKTLLPVNLTNSTVMEQVKLYPQPAKEMVTIEWDGFQEGQNLNISVYTTSGIQVYGRSYPQFSENRIDLDVSGWSSGMYILRLENNGSIRSLKMIR